MAPKSSEISNLMQNLTVSEASVFDSLNVSELVALYSSTENKLDAFKSCGGFFTGLPQFTQDNDLNKFMAILSPYVKEKLQSDLEFFDKIMDLCVALNPEWSVTLDSSILLRQLAELENFDVLQYLLTNYTVDITSDWYQNICKTKIDGELSEEQQKIQELFQTIYSNTMGAIEYLNEDCVESDEGSFPLALRSHLTENYGAINTYIVWYAWAHDCRHLDVLINSMDLILDLNTWIALTTDEEKQESLREGVLGKLMADEVSENIFYRLPNLRKLDLGGVDFQSRWSHLSKLTNLQELVLSGAELHFVADDAFLGLSNLRMLDLSYNKLLALYDNQFKSLVNLENLNLTGNSIEDILEDSFNGLDKLTCLDLSGSKIDLESFSMLKKLPSVEILILHSATFVNGCFPESSFNAFPNLKELQLNSSVFEDKKATGFFSGVMSKISSDCTEEKIASGFFSGVPNLERLFLTYTKFGLFPLGILDPLVNLESVDLTSCELNSLPEELFSSNLKLKELALESNGSLNVIPEKIINRLRSLESISVDDERIENLQWVKENVPRNCSVSTIIA